MPEILLKNAPDGPVIDVPTPGEEDGRGVITLNTAVIKYSVTAEQLAILEQKYSSDSMPKDLSVKQNYDTVRKAVSHLRSLRSATEDHRKSLKAEALRFGKMVDEAAGQIKSRILSLEDPLKARKDEFDTKVELEKREKARLEEERIDRITAEIALIKALPQSLMSSSSSSIMERITELQSNQPSEWAAEFADKAALAIAETIAQLIELHSMRVMVEQAKKERAERVEAERAAVEAERAAVEAERAAVEAERARLAEENRKMQAELAAQRAKMEEESREQREEMAAKQAAMDEELKKQQAIISSQRASMEAEARDKAEKEAAEARAKAEAEAKAKAEKEAAEAAEQARLAEIERTRLAAEAAEQARLAEIERERLAAENFERMRDEALSDIQGYISKFEIINAIIAGKIRHISFGK